jgi:cell division protein FtsL
MKLSRSARLSVLLNVWLLCMVLGTALMLVRWQYQSRHLYVTLEKAEHLGKQLANDNASALADKRQLAAPARIERAAAQSLGMRGADAAITIYVSGSPAAGTKP